MTRLPRPFASSHGLFTKAACHCGTARFELRLTDGVRSIRRGTCSYCQMRGANAVSVRTPDLRFLAGEENLSLYRFETGTARPFFCSICGNYTQHQRRSSPDLFGGNVGCIAGISPFAFAQVPISDGGNHPADTGRPARQAGTLRYTKAPWLQRHNLLPSPVPRLLVANILGGRPQAVGGRQPPSRRRA